MSNTAKGVLVFSSIAMVYLAFAFVLWKLDPHDWSQGIRCGFVLTELFVGTVVTGTLSHVDSGDDDHYTKNKINEQ